MRVVILLTCVWCVSCGKVPRKVTIFEQKEVREMRVDNVPVRSLAGFHPTQRGRVAAYADYVWYNEGGTRTVRPTGVSTSVHEVSGGAWGLLKRSQQESDVFLELTDPVFEAFLDFSEHRAAVRQDGRWGFIDTTGDVVVDCRFDTAVPPPYSFPNWYYVYRDGMAWVMQNGRSFRINRDGDRVDDESFEMDAFYVDRDWNVENDLDTGMVTWFKAGNQWGLMDWKTAVIMKPAMDQPREFRRYTADLFWIKSRNQWGLWDEKSETWKQTPQFDHVEVHKKLTWANVGGAPGLLSVQGGAWTLLDSLGHVVITLGAAPDLERTGWMPVRVDGQWGYWYDDRLHRKTRGLGFSHEAQQRLDSILGELGSWGDTAGIK